MPQRQVLHVRSVPTDPDGRSPAPTEAIAELEVDGHRLVYEVHGDGPRVFVFLHGLLLDAAMNRTIARRLAREGHRVLLLELLGHGRSDKVRHATEHRLEFHAAHVVALLDHLGLEQAVVGGTSLGANVALQVAVQSPERVRAMVLEMPVLERGAVAAAAQFTPLLLALRYGWPVLRPATRLAARIPRTGTPVDSFLGLASTDPRALAAVLHGLFAGPGCPPARDRRALTHPSLVIGHRGDLLHPMNDAAALAAELPNAQLVRAWSVVEARTFPARITAAIDRFLADVWAPRLAEDTQHA
ncbi:MAG: alpha/beta fold hydrolase [Actinomycetes bacterium]